jgi:hypothetical protein
MARQRKKPVLKRTFEVSDEEVIGLRADVKRKARQAEIKLKAEREKARKKRMMKLAKPRKRHRY